MPASGKVSVFWHIVFVLFVPIAGLWAFYRIKKLRKSIIYILVPEIILAVSVLFVVVDGLLYYEIIDGKEELLIVDQDKADAVFDSIAVVSFFINVGIQVWAVYLIYKWSKEWNMQDQSITDNAKSELDDHFKKKIEIINKNIDLDKLVSEIESFLMKKHDDPLDYATYKLHQLPEKELKIFEINYGIKSPTTKFVIVLYGDSNNVQIFDHIPRDYTTYAEILLISHVLFLPKIVNAKVFYNKLWQQIENILKSLEN